MENLGKYEHGWIERNKAQTQLQNQTKKPEEHTSGFFQISNFLQWQKTKAVYSISI